MRGYIQKFMPLWPGCHLKQFLGEGSYGEVWECEFIDENGVCHTEAIKEVVVPTFSSGSLNGAKIQGLDPDGAKHYYESVLRATVKEADMMCTLSACDSVVQFHGYKVVDLSEIGEFGWSIYIRMEILQSLNEFLIEDGITYEEIARLGIDISRALELCQAENLVHRDIKPENLFFDPETRLFKLGDFGVAHYLDRPTAGKGRAGTLTHMPPEVYSGEKFSFSSDQYALGMIVYKLLNDNRIPCLPEYPQAYSVEDRDAALVKRLHGCEILLPASYKRDISIAGLTIKLDESVCMRDRLCEIATKAVANDCSKRHKDVSEFRSELEECLRMIQPKEEG